MVRLNEIRQNEVAVAFPERRDAELIFIGLIRTPWTSRLDCPRLGRLDGPICTIEVFDPWRQALAGADAFERLEMLYWLDQSRRDLVMQSPPSDGRTRGTFSLRTPVRPNPIGTTIVRLIDCASVILRVRGMDCLDGTPLLDIKPDRDLFAPVAPPQPGDFQTSP